VKREIQRRAETPQQPRIFVQIASYRDPDCQWTIKDLFEKALHPERIFVGVTWQFVEKEDRGCFVEPYRYPEQVRVHVSDARQSKGTCWARSVGQRLWRGEEFALQIDSHMRFEPGWDEKLLSVWARCKNEKAVVTGYMPGFTPPDTFQREWIFGMSATEFDEDGILRFSGAPAWRTGGGEPSHPVPGAFVSGNMLFGPASMIRDVPYDPNLYFFGEEVSLAVRLWTHGYDIYHPNQLLMFHNWSRKARRTHFDDHAWEERHAKAVRRVRQMLLVGEEGSGTPMGRYGLGTARTLGEYQRYSGVDFGTMSFSARAAKCNYILARHSRSAS
jgi:UDP-N-acetylglucosamine (GlcNAc):hydroxyproline polypeptide GlcNAc-transferase